MPHTSISPLLSVRRGAQAIEFYKSAFAAELLYRVDAPDGEVVARLAVDGAEFWVDDPDGAFAKAIAAGAAVVWPVGNRHGWRLGRIVDPFGHHWEIGKPLS